MSHLFLSRKLAGRIVVCVLALACLGLWQSNIRLRERIAIEKCTGVVKFEMSQFDSPRWAAPLFRYLGTDYLPFREPSVVELTIDEAMSDADVAFLGELPSTITQLSIHNSQITDATLQRMASWTRIVRLEIDSCPNITDHGLRAFTKCKLQSVELRRTAATHEGLFTLNLNAASSMEVDFHVIGSATPAEWSRLGSLAVLEIYSDHRTDGQPRYSFLRGCTGLEHLDLNVDLADEALDELVRLPKLYSLRARGVSEIAFERIMGELGAVDFTLDGDFVGARPERFAQSRAKRLQLRSRNLSDDALVGIGRMSGLEFLSIEAPKVTGKGIAQLAGTNIGELWLEQVKLTDRDVAVFTRMSKLRILDLASTGVTVQGRDKLYTALPNLQLHWSGP